MWQEITPNTRKKHVQMKSGTMNVVNDYAGFSMAKLWWFFLRDALQTEISFCLQQSVGKVLSARLPLFS